MFLKCLNFPQEIGFCHSLVVEYIPMQVSIFRTRKNANAEQHLVSKKLFFLLDSACQCFLKFSQSEPNHVSCKTKPCNVFRELETVTLSKNSTRDHFSVGVYILSYYEYKIVYFHKVSCFYHKLHDFSCYQTH